MKNDGASKGPTVDERFKERLNKLIIHLTKRLTRAHQGGMTGQVVIEAHITQGMLNNAYIQPRTKLDIE